MAEAQASLVLRLKDLISKELSIVGSKVEELGKKLEKSKFIFAGVFGSIVAGVGLSVKAFAEEEIAIATLTQALKNQGDARQSTVEDLKSFAGELQKVTNFADDQILSTQSLLVTYGATGEQLKKMTKATLDLAAAKNIDLRSAADLLGKAFAGETSMLSRYGIIVDENLTKSEKFAEAMRKINETMGGAAMAQAQTFTGAMARLKNIFGDFMETIGARFAPMLTAVADGLGELIGKFSGLSEDTKDMIFSFVTFTAVLTGLLTGLAGLMFILPALGAAFGVIASPIGLAAAAVAGLVTWLVGGKKEMAELAKGGMKAALEVGQAFSKLLEGDFTGAFEKMKDVARKAWEGIRDIISGNAASIEERIREKTERINQLEQEEADFKATLEAQKLAGASLSYKIQEETAQIHFEKEQELNRLREELRGLQTQQDTQREQQKSVEEDAALAARKTKLKQEHTENIKAFDEKMQKLFERDQSWKKVLSKMQQVADEETRVQLEEQSKKEVKIEQAKATTKMAISNQLQFIAANTGRVGFYIAKGLAIGEAIMNTAVGVTSALKLGPLLGPPLAVLIGALGAAQVGIISSQIANFAEGGLVMPTAGGTIARIGEAGSAEAVIPLNNSEATREIREAIGGEGVTVNINAGVIVADDLALREFAEKIDEKLFELRRNRQSVSF